MVPNLSSKIDILPDYTLAPDEVPLIGSLVLEDAERDRLKSRIAESLERQGMALVAHYYVDGDIQDLAEQTGGCVSDSLEMARFGRDHSENCIRPFKMDLERVKTYTFAAGSFLALP